MLFIHPILPFRRLCPHALWRGDRAARCVYLTFDDGPIPEVTPWVLDTLDRYGIKATFFVVGDNIRRHPDLYRQLLLRGHAVGNHTCHHLRGRCSASDTYHDDVLHCQHLMRQHQPADAPGTVTTLFRPPHGFVALGQQRRLEHEGMQLVQWDIVTRDYNPRNTPRRILAVVRRYVRPGSIITFHDSLRSEPRLRQALPAVIDHLQHEGYEFRTL